jgi:hypothetical protein
MRTKITAVAIATVMLVVLSAAVPVFATTIGQPSGGTYIVAVDGAGRPQPFTVVASGMKAGSLAYVEECDGAPLTHVDWSPTLHCDIGTAPAPAVVAHNGIATFKANDRNHAFHPFRGSSPQAIFNCLAPRDADPHNGLASYRTCRLRVSSNNASVTDDQAFLDLRLSDAAPAVGATGGGATHTGGAAAPQGNQAQASAHVGAASGSGSPQAGSDDPANAAASNSSGHGSNGRLAFTGAMILALIAFGCALIVIGVVLARARRSRRDAMGRHV